MIELIKTMFSAECGFRLRHQLYCPGCGGTRALIALLQGDIIASIQYNPITLLFLLDIFLMALFAIIRRISNKKYTFVRFRLLYNLGFLIFIGVYFVLRNYLWVAHGIDLLGDMR